MYSSKLIFAILILTSGTASATELTARQLYYRCYAHFTGTQASSSDTRLASLDASASTDEAIDQCMSLLASASLRSDGSIETQTAGEPDPIARRVLQTFNDFHHTWFSRWDFSADDKCATHEVYDVNEMSYHLTYNLLTGNHYSQTITSADTFESIRTGSQARNFFINCPTYEERQNLTFVYGDAETPYTPKTTAVGRLDGIRPRQGHPTTVPEVFVNDQYLSNSHPMHASHGAGIIGTVPYLMLNMGRAPDSPPIDGGVQMPRRWSKSVLGDMLCRELPVLRAEDVTSMVQSSGTNIPFRGGTSCMQCHATMDRMTGGIRHLQLGFTNPSAAGGTLQLYAHAQDGGLSAEQHPVESDSAYHQRARRGQFLFRGFDGTLHNVEYEGLEQLGQAIAGTTDFYICAASRYYQFLTGVTVPIHDYTDPAAPTPSDDELLHRERLVALGKSLQQHGDLTRLIREIISTPTYRQQGYGEGQ